MINCPECNAQHYPGTLFCDTCGAAVSPAAQAHVAATRPPGGSPAKVRIAAVEKVTPNADSARRIDNTITPPIRESHALSARLPHHNAELTFRGDLIQVGRADPDAGFTPELDLTSYGGQERGVSRRHATIQWVEGGYVIIDQHSSNGTWLDGVRLVAGYAYQIPPGAHVRFGGLLVQLAIAD